jgi:kynurenine formamidase
MNTATPRWTRRPEHSTWGDWGPDDQLGRMNLLTREKVLSGIAEVREGRTFCLSLPLDYPGGSVLNPRRTPPVLRPVQRRNGRPNMTYPMRCDDPTATDLICDDQVLMTLQYSTQWDSLAHIGQMFDVDGDGKPEDVFYNGYRAGSDVAGPLVWRGTEATPYDGPQGAQKLSVENMAVACLQGRAVMIDLEAHFGRQGTLIGYDELRLVLDKDGITVEPGDFVCFRTGFAQMLLDMKRNPDADVLFGTTSALDGRDDRLLQWVTDSGAVALIADNYAVETLPARACTDAFCATLPLHAHCLFKLGVNLGEMWYLSELADWLRANGRSRFLLTAPPLRLPGAVGSPATPVATV